MALLVGRVRRMEKVGGRSSHFGGTGAVFGSCSRDSE